MLVFTLYTRERGLSFTLRYRKSQAYLGAVNYADICGI